MIRQLEFDNNNWMSNLEDGGNNSCKYHKIHKMKKISDSTISQSELTFNFEGVLSQQFDLN